jgi:uncharacterized repeat protein (TIGR01451 family)
MKQCLAVDGLTTRATRPRLRFKWLKDRTAPAIITPFNVGFTTNDTGDIAGLNVATNTATITHAGQFDPNTASATVTPAALADLALTKGVSDDDAILGDLLSSALTAATNIQANVGDLVTFTVTLINHGPDDATGVVIRDTLPSGVTFVGAKASQGTFDPATGLWNVGAIANQGRAILLIRARVTAPGLQFSFAQIVAAD